MATPGSVRARLDNVSLLRLRFDHTLISVQANETADIARTRAIEALREKKEMASKLAEAQQALDALKQQVCLLARFFPVLPSSIDRHCLRRKICNSNNKSGCSPKSPR